MSRIEVPLEEVNNVVDAQQAVEDAANGLGALIELVVETSTEGNDKQVFLVYNKAQGWRVRFDGWDGEGP